MTPPTSTTDAPAAAPAVRTGAPWLIDDRTWAAIEPLLPPRQRRHRHPGRRRLDDRLVLQGVLYVLHNGVGWEQLPKSLGFGSGMTCWRRLREWQDEGAWERIHAAALGRHGPG